MKKTILFTALIILLATSCKNDKKAQTADNQTTEIINEIPFLGSWTRSFDMGNNTNATVNYNIYKDSIQYEMLGPMNTKYTLVKDVFSPKGDRWVGKRGEIPYVIFVKNSSKDAITLLKMKVESKSKALLMPFPSDTARSKFSSWNTFKKK